MDAKISDNLITLLSFPSSKIIILVLMIVGAILILSRYVYRWKGIAQDFGERFLSYVLGPILVFGGVCVLVFVGMQAPPNITGEFNGVLNKELSVIYNGFTEKSDNLSIGFIFKNNTNENLSIGIAQSPGDTVLSDNKGNASTTFEVVGLPKLYPGNSNSTSRYRNYHLNNDSNALQILNPGVEQPVAISFDRRNLVGKAFTAKIGVITMGAEDRKQIQDSFNIKFVTK
jgi:hypothetical protein